MRKHLIGLLLAIPLMIVNPVANANTYGFTQISNNGSPSVASQLQVDVTNFGGAALFKFTNTAGIASSITDIYFDYGNTNYFTFLSNSVLLLAGESSGVSFSDGANPSNLPDGSAVSFTADFGADSNSPVMSNGVNHPSEWVAFLGMFRSGKSFDDLISGLNGGLFRIGLHVQSIGGGTSEAFVNNTPLNPVPLPAAAWLFGSALLGFVSLSNRRKG